MTDYQTQPSSAAYLSFYPDMMRRVMIGINPHVVKFFTIVAFHGNAIGAFNVGVHGLVKLGYNGDQVPHFYQRCVNLGLLRRIFEARGMATWYQLHPALLRMPHDNRLKALAQSSVPYAPLIGVDPFDPSLAPEVQFVLRTLDPRANGTLQFWAIDDVYGDGGYWVCSDHPALVGDRNVGDGTDHQNRGDRNLGDGADHHNYRGDRNGDRIAGENSDHPSGFDVQYGDRNLGEEPDQLSHRGDRNLTQIPPQPDRQADQINDSSRAKADSRRDQADQKQIVPSKAGNALSASQSAYTNGQVPQRTNYANGSQFAARSAGANPNEISRSRVESREQNPSPLPPSPTGDRPKVSKLKNPLRNAAEEALAQLLKSRTGGKMSVEMARGYVATYGAPRVKDAVQTWINMTDSERNEVKNPAGYLTRLIQSSDGQVDPPPTWEQPRRTYDMGDPESCRAALEDTTLSDDERSVYALALQAAERANGYAGDEWYLPK